MNTLQNRLLFKLSTYWIYDLALFTESNGIGLKFLSSMLLKWLWNVYGPLSAASHKLISPTAGHTFLYKSRKNYATSLGRHSYVYNHVYFFTSLLWNCFFIDKDCRE